MGSMFSWIGVQAPKAEVLKALDLVETDEIVSPGLRAHMRRSRNELSCRELPNGWTIVFSEKFEWAKPQRVQALSTLGLAIGCQYEDKAEMTSCVWAAKDGDPLWRVFHDSKSMFRLDVEGEPPPQFAAIREKVFSEQTAEGGEEASVDYVCEAPLILAQSICGFHPLEDAEDELQFTVVDEPSYAYPNPPKRIGPGFFARLFGRY